MTIGTRLYTLLKGQYVGSDSNGNRYYQSKRKRVNGHLKRWVMYYKDKEPSTVTPDWHGWLHYMTDTIPETRYKWQKNPEPNHTGTDSAYFPPGHKRGENQRKKATGDYEAWTP